MKYIPRIIAHRGASANVPENTLIAFQRAFQEGVDGVELDVRMTADGQIVCFHDAETARVAGQPLVVADETYERLKTLDVGSWKGGEFADSRIPLLREVLAKIPGGKHIFIDVKEGLGIVAPLLEVIGQSRIEPRQIYLLAFDLEVVAKLKRLNPGVKTLWLVEHASNWLGRYKLDVETVIETVIQAKIDGLGLKNHVGITRKVAKAILGADAHLYIWGVENPAEARRYATYEVSSIACADPATILKTFR